MTYYRFGTKRRDYIWHREELKASNAAGVPSNPICVHCELPVAPNQPWDDSHVDIPRTFGGRKTGVGHRACNQKDNHEKVAPLVAKSNRVRKKDLRLKGPGRGRYPMRAGVRSPISKTFRRGVVPRESQAQKHARTMARRRISIEPGGGDDAR